MPPRRQPDQTAPKPVQSDRKYQRTGGEVSMRAPSRGSI